MKQLLVFSAALAAMTLLVAPIWAQNAPTLQPNLVRTTQTFSGCVLDEAARPVAGALVLAAQNPTFSPVKSDGEGRFQLQNLPNGKITLFAAKNHDFGMIENAEEGAQIILKTVPVPPQDKARAVQLMESAAGDWRTSYGIRGIGLRDPDWYFAHVRWTEMSPFFLNPFYRALLRQTEVQDNLPLLQKQLTEALEKLTFFKNPDDRVFGALDWFSLVVKYQPETAKAWLLEQNDALSTRSQATNPAMWRALMLMVFGPEVGLEREAQNAQQIFFVLNDQRDAASLWWFWNSAAPIIGYGDLEWLENLVNEADVKPITQIAIYAAALPILSKGRDLSWATRVWGKLQQLREDPSVKEWDKPENLKKNGVSSSSEIIATAAADYALALSRTDLDGALRLTEQSQDADLIRGAIARDLMRRGEKEKGLALFEQTFQKYGGHPRLLQVWAQYEPQKAEAALLQTLENWSPDAEKSRADMAFGYTQLLSHNHPDLGRLFLEWLLTTATVNSTQQKPVSYQYAPALAVGAMAAFDAARSDELKAALAKRDDLKSYLAFAVAWQVNMAFTAPEERPQFPVGFSDKEAFLD